MTSEIELYSGKPLTEQVADYILNYIIDLGLEVGSKLPNEFELAQQLKVGRGTVREAVKVLVSRNVLEIRRGAGTYVSDRQGITEDPLGLTFIKNKKHLALDLLQVRLMLEPEIARMAAEHATPEQKEALILQCDKVELMIQQDKNHMEEDVRLHEMIAACSQNQVVEKLVPIINSSIAVFVDVTNGRLRQETIQTHREIVNAIVNSDPEGARCSMHMHLLYNRRAIFQNEEHKEM